MKNQIRNIIVISTIALTGMSMQLFAQSKIGDNKGTIGAGSLLELESTNKAFVLPRMTTAQMKLIPSPVEGMLIFNTTDSCISQYNTGDWNSLCDNFEHCNISFADQSDPNTVGTVFDPPGSQQSSCALYIGADGTSWEWDGANYTTVARPRDVEPWFYCTTQKPAKTLTQNIYHFGSVIIGKGNFFSIGKNSIIVGSSNVVTDAYSGAFGFQNYDSSAYSYTLGSFNTIADKPNGSHFIAGSLNTIDGGTGADFIGNRNNTITNGGSSAVFGSGNKSSMLYSFVAGFQNTNNATTGTILGSANYNTADNAGIFGYADSITSITNSGAWAIGRANKVTSDRGIAIGNNLIVNEDYNVVAGRFNNSRANALFTIGAGSSEATRRNAMIVLSTALTDATNSASAIMVVMPNLPIYATDADANTSTILPSGGLYRITGNNSLRIKP